MSEKRSIDRVPEAAELAHRVQLVRDLAVDEVEDVGDDHDDAGADEVPARQRERGARR